MNNQPATPKLTQVVDRKPLATTRYRDERGRMWMRQPRTRNLIRIS